MNSGQPLRSPGKKRDSLPPALRNALIVSGVLHAVVLTIAIFGLPYLPFDHDEVIESAIVVDLVEIGERTAAPPPAPKTDSQNVPKPPKVQDPVKPDPMPEQPKPEPPKPQPQPTPAPPPPAPEPPKPQPQPAPPPPEPKKDTVPDPVPEKKPEPKEEPKPVPPVPDVRPDKKPEPPKKTDQAAAQQDNSKSPNKKADDDPFKSLMQNVEKFRNESKPQSGQQGMPEPQSASGSGPRIYNAPIAEKATMSEIDFIRAQVEKNWIIDPGAQGVANLVIALRVFMNQDGTVADVRVEDSGRYNSDPAYRALADSAVRAVYKSSPLQYPAQKYDTFRNIVLTFRPESRL